MSSIEAMYRPAFAALLAALSVLLAACGGGGAGSEGTGTIPAGAEFAPASAAAYVVVETDTESEQWRNAERLADRFPGRDEALARFHRALEDEDLDWERDVKPALGDEVHAVSFDLSSDDNAVVFTKPDDPAKLEQLLRKGDDDVVSRRIEGWSVIAESEALLDRFEQERERASLADVPSFEDAMEALPEQAIGRVYLRGEPLQNAVEEGVEEEGGPANLTERAGRLQAFAAAASAEEDGVRTEIVVLTDRELEVEPYEASLPDELSGGALALYSFGGLEKSLRDALRTVGDVVPGFDRQRAQIENALGFSIEGDLLPLFEKEGAVAVYPGTSIPAVTFALAVDDESKARRVLQQIGALAELGETATKRPFTAGSVRGTEIAFTGAGFSIFHAVVDGKLVVSNSEERIGDVGAGGQRLSDDSDFSAAREAAGMPDETLGFLFLDLEDGIPFALDYAEREDADVPPEARANTAPLRSFLAWAERDGKRTEVTSFLSID